MAERKQDMGREMRAFITPVRVVSVVIFILFSLLTYFAGRTWDKASVDMSAVQASVARLQNEKLDVARYEKD